jgi:hypothetical protein
MDKETSPGEVMESRLDAEEAGIIEIRMLDQIETIVKKAPEG